MAGRLDRGAFGAADGWFGSVEERSPPRLTGQGTSRSGPQKIGLRWCGEAKCHVSACKMR